MLRIVATIIILLFLLYWWRDKVDFKATFQKYIPLATKSEIVVKEPTIISVDFIYYLSDKNAINQMGENPIVDLTKVDRIGSIVNFQNNSDADVKVSVPKLNVSLSNGESGDSESISGFYDSIIPAQATGHLPRGKDFSAAALLELLRKNENFSITYRPIGFYHEKGDDKNKKEFTQSIRCRNFFTKDKLPEFQLVCSLIDN